MSHISKTAFSHTKCVNLEYQCLVEFRRSTVNLTLFTFVIYSGENYALVFVKWRKTGNLAKVITVYCVLCDTL